MAKPGDAKMFIRGFRNSLALALFLAAGSAGAQQLSDKQLIASLGQVSQAAPVVDVGLLVQEVNASVGQGVSRLISRTTPLRSSRNRTAQSD
jgi:hypothetical protein